MVAGVPQALFELFDPTAAVIPDVLGMWETVPTLPPDRLVLGGGAASSNAPIWRISLPANQQLALAQLAAAEEHLRASQQSLAGVTGRLDRLVATQTGVLGGSADTVPAQPEQNLLALLALPPDGSGEAVLGGVGDVAREGWEQANQQLRAFTERALRAVAYYAWVETQVAQQLLARTVVGWIGGMHTAWLAGIGPAQMALHQRSLALALASREALVRTVSIVARGAAILATMSASPVAAITSLPAAWKFVTDVLAEARAEELSLDGSR